jgi:type VI secretion system protein ImpL
MRFARRSAPRFPFDNAATQAGAGRSRAVGGYAERLAPRLDTAVAGIVSSLAGRRVQLLGRESVPERRLTGYELPREMGKLGTPVSRFLVELCRPMHLGVSPQLRGFYFVGHGRSSSPTSRRLPPRGLPQHR